MKRCLTLTLLCCGIFSCAQVSPQRMEKISDSLFSSFDIEPGPGVAVLVVQDGKIAFKKGYGLANLSYDIRITPATVFDIASVSKQFTGYAISTLIQQGKLSPDDDIHKFLPDVPDFGKKILIRHLIHHTSGLRDWPEVLHAAGWRWDEAFTWDDILRMVKQQKELDFDPGSKYQYSNTGYNLLAVIVEKVTGKSFPVWVKENIFQPLQMHSSQVLSDISAVVPNGAESYYKDGSRYRHSADMLTAWGSSSIYTTVEDLARWVIAFRTGLDEKNPVYERMLETDTLNNGGKNNYAYGNSIQNDQGLRNINHTGGWASFATVISTYPSENLSIILLSNNGGFDSYGNANKMARALFGEKFRPASGPVREDYSGKPTIAIDTSILRKYANTYQLGDSWYVTFTLEHGKLMVQATGEPKFETEPKSDTVIWVPAYNSAFVFRQIGDKAHSVFYHNSPASIIQPLTIDASQLTGYAGNYYSSELETTYRVYVDKGKLMAHHMRIGELALSPDAGTRDLFFGDIGKLQFVRDSQGKVNGFKLSGGRIRNIRFDRQ